jgi:hypothetical protein
MQSFKLNYAEDPNGVPYLDITISDKQRRRRIVVTKGAFAGARTDVERIDLAPADASVTDELALLLDRRDFSAIDSMLSTLEDLTGGW